MNRVIRDLTVQNPKRTSQSFIERNVLYPYYAGFSSSFANSVLTSVDLSKNAKIADPWNGSGTTTTAAAKLGYRAIGYDLNPVMVIAAKAATVNCREKSSLWPIATDIMRKALENDSCSKDKSDSLCTWIIPSSAMVIRRIEKALQKLLIDSNKYEYLINRENYDSLSVIASFFYTALFRCTRKLISKFIASNPTWVKKPKSLSSRLRPSASYILELFHGEVQKMIQSIDEKETFMNCQNTETVYLKVGSSEKLPDDDKSIDLVLSSPPYCTRIDYAVSTMPELAILGYGIDKEFKALRKELIGTSTVPPTYIEPLQLWGKTCNCFLSKLSEHESKASKTYYLKNHIQYFNAIYKSFSEISRILKQDGNCILVVQDSYYKDLHNDLPRIFIEMAETQSLSLERRVDFELRKTMANINPKVDRSRRERTTESVLCFSKV